MVRRNRRGSPYAAALLAAALVLAGCGGTDDEDPPAGGNGPATLWVRAADAPLDEALVKAWNAANPDRKVELVSIPDAQYVQKFLQATRSGDVPDIAAVDIANANALVTEGLLQDVSDRVTALPYADKLAPAAQKVCTANGTVYCVPHQLDASVLYYNKELFRKAGLDPDKPPASFAEIIDYAAAIRGLGGDTYGFYFAGNCAGCNAYTTLPMIWASGGDLLAEGGKSATTADPAVASTLGLLRTLWDRKLMPPAAKDETGATWLNSFQSGQIGMIALGSFGVGVFGADDKLDFGLAPIPGANGGTGAFVGGDIVGIPTKAKNAQTAWDFIEWTLSEQVQRDIVAKTHLVVRTDVVDNPVTAANPMLHQANKLIDRARVPVTADYNALFIDPASPFLKLIRDYVFEGQDGAIAQAQSAFDQRMGS